MPVNNTTSSYFFASNSSPDAISSYLIPSGTHQQDAQSTLQQAARSSNADSTYVQPQGGYGSGVSATNSVYLSPHAAQGKNRTSTPAPIQRRPSSTRRRSTRRRQPSTRRRSTRRRQPSTRRRCRTRRELPSMHHRSTRRRPLSTRRRRTRRRPLSCRRCRTKRELPSQYPTKTANIQLNPTTVVLQPLMDRNYYEAPYSANDEMSLSTRTAVMQASPTTAICQGSAQPKGVGSTESVYFGVSGVSNTKSSTPVHKASAVASNVLVYFTPGTQGKAADTASVYFMPK